MKRAIGLLALFSLAIALVSLSDALRSANMWLVASTGMLGVASPLHKNIVVINVPLNDNDLQKDRESIAALLGRLVQDPPEKRPDKIILDVDITNKAPGLDALTKAVEGVRSADVKFYITANPDDKAGSRDFLNDFAPFYRSIDGHYGHTQMHWQGGVLWYENRIETPRGDVIQALPIIFDDDESAEFVQGQTLFRVGTEADRERVAWNFDPEAAPGKEFRARPGADAMPTLNDKTVVIGTLDEVGGDFNEDAGRYGLDLLAWALSERMGNEALVPPKLREGPAWAVGMTLAMSLAAAGLFFLLFRALPSQRQRLWLLGAIAAALAVLLFAALVLALRALDQLYVQWILVLAGIAIATGVTGYALNGRLLIDALKLDMESPDRVTASTHDVFISYSRTPENLKWVSERVVQPLQAAGLKVWFDKQSILFGTSWYEKLALGIQGSRYFVPIYSEDYFAKDFCKFEIELAAIRRARETNFILPLARVTTGVPPGYQHINFIDVNERQDFIEAVLAAVKPPAKLD